MNHFAPLPGSLTWGLSDVLVRLGEAMSVLPMLLLLLWGTTIAESAAAWPSEGKVVYYRPATISDRCLVPEHLYNFDEDASLSCDRFPPEQIFRFTEAIVGTKIEISFHGKIVTGRWYSAARNPENEDISKIVLDGKIFFRKTPLGSKVDEGSIIGIRKGSLIQAKANSEGHAPDLGYVRIELRELNDAIEWRQVQHPKQPIGYMPEKEQLLLSLESWLDANDSRNLTTILSPCPPPGANYAAPAAGCVPPNTVVRGTLHKRTVQPQ